MNERVKIIAEQALQLAPEEQRELLDLLTNVIDTEDYEVDPALIEECERRWEAYERGAMEAYSWEEVKAQLRKL